MGRPEQKVAKPMQLAGMRGRFAMPKDYWYVERKVVKLRFGNILRWVLLANEMKRPVEEIGWRMFTLQVDLITSRTSHTTAAVLESKVGRGAAALVCRLGLAYRTGDTIIFRDVAKTVAEGLMRRNQGLLVLPRRRAKDLLGQMVALYEQARGTPYEPNGKETAVLEALRARARDGEIMKRWESALLSRLPRVQTASGLLQHWNQFAREST